MKNEEYLYKVILAPHSSEKSVRVAEQHRQYVFRVLPSATKQDVKKAVEMIFEVNVINVSSTNLKSLKVRNMRTGKWGKKAGYRKMYVTLAQGQQISFVSEAG